MRRRRTTTTWLAAACAATLLAGTTTTSAHADRAQRTLTEVRTQVSELYRKAEVATDAYNAAHERVTQQQKDISPSPGPSTRRRASSRRSPPRPAPSPPPNTAAAAPAPSTRNLQLLLGGDTDAGTALDGAALTEKAAHAANTTISELTTTKSELDTYATAATAELANLTKAQQDAPTRRSRSPPGSPRRTPCWPPSRPSRRPGSTASRTRRPTSRRSPGSNPTPLPS